MTGSDESSWSWLGNAAVPALLVVVEAAWVSAWLSAVVHLMAHGRTIVPVAAVAVPAVLAVAISGATQRLRRPRWGRGVVVVVTLVAGIALSAGAIGSLWLHGSFATLAGDPWNARGGAAAGAALLAWFVAALAWARGTWLGFKELTIGHVVGAVAIATIAYAVLFLEAAGHRSDLSWHAEVTPAIVRVLLSFPLAMALIALVAERDLESRTLSRRVRPNAAWLVAIAVPMAAIALVALLVALAAGELIPLLGAALRAAALLAIAIAAAVVRLIAGLLPAGRAHLPPAEHLRPGRGTFVDRPPGWARAVAIVVAALAGTVLLALLLTLVRALRRLRLRAVRPRRAAPGTDERTSLFTWGHLLAQIVGMVSRLVRRLKPAAATAPHGSPAAPAGADAGGTASVRRHYLTVLGAARSAGHGRRASETPAELRRRLEPVAGAAGGQALSGLTELYELVRYGEQAAGDEEVQRAGADAGAIVAALRGVAEQSPPQAQASAAPSRPPRRGGAARGSR